MPLTSAPIVPEISKDKPAEFLPPGIYSIVSAHLGAKINVEEFARSSRARVEESSKSEVTVWLDDVSRVYVFSFGSVVFLNARPTRELLDQFRAYVVGDHQGPPLSDDFTVEVRPGSEERVEFGRVIISGVGHKKLKLIARILAQSTSLERFEVRADELLERAAAITDSLTDGRVPRTSKEMLRFIGVGLATRRQIVSQLSIIDPPEEVWEDSSLDTLYHAMRTNFELQVRFRSLEYKLELIEEAVQAVVDLHDSRRTYILELIVIVLIAVEVLLAFIRH